MAIYEGERTIAASHINPYLVDAKDVFIYNRNTPICGVPEGGIGNKPIDGGNYLFTLDEKEAFLKQEPQAEKFFKKWWGSDEFINNRPRYCLWLGDCPVAELEKLPHCKARIKAVREFRLSSKSPGTRKIADKPRRFHVENMPKGTSVLIPETSSEKRKYIPMGFMGPDSLCSNAVKLLPGASLYHFGILTSSVHMAWMRAVAGRLEMRYRYSLNLVYNNFPWPTKDNPVLREKIEAAAQAILDARAAEGDVTLATLYDDAIMPDALRKAHQVNDSLVRKAYGFKSTMTEPEIVAELFKMYQARTDEIAAEERRKAEEVSAAKKKSRARKKKDS